MSNIYAEMVCGRLRSIRLTKGFLREQAGACIGVSDEQMQSIESGDCPVTAQQVIQLSELYDVPLHEITNGKLPYTSPDELLNAYHKKEIGTGVLAGGLKVDRLNARKLYVQWCIKTGREW